MPATSTDDSRLFCRVIMWHWYRRHSTFALSGSVTSSRKLTHTLSPGKRGPAIRRRMPYIENHSLTNASSHLLIGLWVCASVGRVHRGSSKQLDDDLNYSLYSHCHCITLMERGGQCEPWSTLDQHSNTRLSTGNGWVERVPEWTRSDWAHQASTYIPAGHEQCSLTHFTLQVFRQLIVCIN